jgi:hypothetical protein
MTIKSEEIALLITRLTVALMQTEACAAEIEARICSPESACARPLGGSPSNSDQVRSSLIRLSIRRELLLKPQTPDETQAGAILNRVLAMFASPAGEIETGFHTQEIGHLGLNLLVSDAGEFRLVVVDWENVGPSSHFVKELFMATGTLACLDPPEVSVFERGQWERLLLTTN